MELDKEKNDFDVERIKLKDTMEELKLEKDKLKKEMVKVADEERKLSEASED